MIVCGANIGSTSLKTTILEVDADERLQQLAEANLARVKDAGPSTFSHRPGLAGASMTGRIHGGMHHCHQRVWADISFLIRCYESGVHPAC